MTVRSCKRQTNTDPRKKRDWGDYTGMINRCSPPAFGPMPRHVLEIRLQENQWKRILRIAQARKKSRSWVVRYCLFRLIARPRGAGKIPFESGRCFGVVARKDMHRHRLCLYGDDELFIRTSAAVAGCTMTRLVRVALEQNLALLERGLISGCVFFALAFFWHGIKLFKDVEFPIKTPEKTNLRFTRFQEKDYW